MHAQFTRVIYVIPVVQLNFNFGKKKNKKKTKTKNQQLYNPIKMIPEQREFKFFFSKLLS